MSDGGLASLDAELPQLLLTTGLRMGDNEAGSEEDINKKRLLGHGFCTLTLAAEE